MAITRNVLFGSSTSGRTTGQTTRANLFGSQKGQVGKTTRSGLFGSQIRARTPSPDLTTSEGLYQMAKQSGLQKRADKILSEKGEEVKRFWSGGFVSDIFDTLNTLQYGIVGMIKGKGFAEGVRTRQSFSDKDALGDFGIPGMIAGIALDIAVDPLTYIAPWTIAKKIPGVAKGAKAVRGAIKAKAVAKAGVLGRTGNFLGRKFIWKFGKDPVYVEAWQRSVVNQSIGSRNILEMIKDVAKISPESAKHLLKRDESFHFVRRGLGELKGILSDDEMWRVARAYSVLDDLGKQAVDLNILSKGKWEQNLGRYIKNAYEEYENIQGKGLFGFLRKGVKGIKKRKAVSLARRKELGEIEDPAYLLFRSTMDLHKDIENVKFFNWVSKRFGSDVPLEGFEQMPMSRKFFTASTGEKIQMLKRIKGLNKKLRPILKQLKKTQKLGRKTTTQIDDIGRNLSKLSTMREEEFFKFFQAGQEFTKQINKARKLGTLPSRLVGVAEEMKRFKNFDEFAKSKTFFKVNQLYEGGLLERAGIKNVKEFFERVKNPYQVASSKIISRTAKGNLKKLVKVQRQIENLGEKSKILKGIDKKSIDDAIDLLKRSVDDIGKEKVMTNLKIFNAEMGELAGKFVPKGIKDDLTELVKPRTYGAARKVVAGFKFGKVILNPATHVRNVVSNTILNWWKLGIGPWRLDKYARGVKAITTKNDWYQRAVRQGYEASTYVAREINDLLLGPDGRKAGKAFGGAWKKTVKKVSSIYQREEGIAKLTAFIDFAKKGMDDGKAWRLAESATFNYGQVTPFIRRVRESLFGFPFITFTYKATPIAIETALKHPRRISAIGKLKNAIENQADLKRTARERASEPAWVRDGFYIKLPMKDKYDRSAYFDLTYIIPFGDLVSGDWAEPQVSRKTGLKESYVTGLMRRSPAINVIREVGMNQDFYGNKIWRDSDSSDKKLGDLFRHLTKTYMPPLISDQIPGGYKSKGKYVGQRRPTVWQRAKQAKTGTQYRTLMQEMLRNVGAKIQPMDVDIQENYMEWEKKKALKTLLREQGVISEFTRPYIPSQ